MYVFDLTFWLLLVPVALVHARSGPRLQQLLLLVGSLVVYASFGFWLLPALAWVIAVSWFGIQVPRYTDDAAMLDFTQIVISVVLFAPLAVLRYTDAVVGFAGEAAAQASLIDRAWSIDLIFPVGVAFFTLQALDAVIATKRRDRRRVDVTFAEHVLFVCFAPTVLVGPVQRFRHLHPQLRAHRSVGARDVDAAARAVLYALFVKFVVADNVLPIADRVFGSPGQATGPEVVVGSVAFGLGIIADLAAFSAMAIGTARLFGIRLTENVRRPYLATAPAEFWSRWNITVNDWFVRHVYHSSPGNVRFARPAVALTLTFVLVALWYGSRLSLLVWAGLHLGALALQVRAGRRRPPTETPSLFVRGVKVFFTFGFVSYSWLWFAAPSLQDALRLHLRFTDPGLTSVAIGGAFVVVFFGALLVIGDALLDGFPVRAADEEGAHPWFEHQAARGAMVALVLVAILVLSTGDVHQSVLGGR